MVPLEDVLNIIISSESAEVGRSESGDIYFYCDEFEVADIVTLDHHRILLQQFIGCFLVTENKIANGEDSYRKLRTMPYSKYLETPHWKRMRDTMLMKSGHACQLCSSRRRLQVHHRTYERRGCERLADLIVLCDNCHAKFHDKLPQL